MPKSTRSKSGNNSTQSAPSAAHKATQDAPSNTTVEQAIRHVGRTLESDPEYYDQPAREFAPAAGLIDPHGNDLSASPDMRDTTQRLRETLQPDPGPEPLKTRLPGDTSSDPHTDLGPDNAGNGDIRKNKKKAERSHRS